MVHLHGPGRKGTCCEFRRYLVRPSWISRWKRYILVRPQCYIMGDPEEMVRPHNVRSVGAGAVTGENNMSPWVPVKTVHNVVSAVTMILVTVTGPSVDFFISRRSIGGRQPSAQKLKKKSTDGPVTVTSIIRRCHVACSVVKHVLLLC